ncbi:MAG: penicillin-binding protein 2 [Pseudomonadota bacterium]
MSIARPPEEDVSLRPVFSRRAILLGGVQAGLFGVLAAKLHDLQVDKASRFAPLADRNRIDRLPTAPVRGEIRDAAGRLLAFNARDLGVDLVADLAPDLPKLLTQVQRMLGLPDEEVARLIAQAKRQPRLVPIPINAALTWEQFAELSARSTELPGIQTVTRYRRQYGPNRNVTQAMGHFIGYVGAVERFEIDGDPALQLPEMRIGKAGVERGRDAVLRGQGGLLEREVDARGRLVRTLTEKPPVNGTNVVLTVDSALQAKVIKRVARAGQAAAVVIDVRTGAVRAMVSIPTLDNAAFTDGISSQDWRRLRNAPGRPLINKAIRGAYPPGSTFKMVTALAGLEAGLITPRDRLRCDGVHVVGKQKFRCWNGRGHGRVNLHRALRESCNVYFYKLAQQVGMERIAQMGERLGFGQIYDDFALNEQRAGLMPTPGWKRGNLGRGWVIGETLLAGIGQGYVLTTPLQLAVMTARLATGTDVSPAITIDGLSAEPEDLGLDPGHLRAVQKGMFAVLNERAGTARKAALYANGALMAGKTGTAQVQARRVKGRLVRRENHALFVGYAPHDRPRYAVSVIVEHGGSGGKAAAPLARDIMQIVLAHEAGEAFSGARDDDA